MRTVAFVDGNLPLDVDYPEILGPIHITYPVENSDRKKLIKAMFDRSDYMFLRIKAINRTETGIYVQFPNGDFHVFISGYIFERYDDAEDDWINLGFMSTDKYDGLFINYELTQEMLEDIDNGRDILILTMSEKDFSNVDNDSVTILHMLGEDTLERLNDTDTIYEIDKDDTQIYTKVDGEYKRFER